MRDRKIHENDFGRSHKVGYIHTTTNDSKHLQRNAIEAQSGTAILGAIVRLTKKAACSQAHKLQNLVSQPRCCNVLQSRTFTLGVEVRRNRLHYTRPFMDNIQISNSIELTVHSTVIRFIP